MQRHSNLCGDVHAAVRRGSGCQFQPDADMRGDALPRIYLHRPCDLRKLSELLSHLCLLHSDLRRDLRCHLYRPRDLLSHLCGDLCRNLRRHLRSSCDLLSHLRRDLCSDLWRRCHLPHLLHTLCWVPRLHAAGAACLPPPDSRTPSRSRGRCRQRWRRHLRRPDALRRRPDLLPDLRPRRHL